MRVVIVAALALLVSVASAQAQQRPKLQITGDIVKDTAANFAPKKNAPKLPAGACDFNLFASLAADNVIQSIQGCINSQVSDAASAFLPDVTAALASATAFGDQPGVACLKPGLAIVQAAVGTPAVAAVPEVPATATTPAVPATAAVPAVVPGPILIFQKFREFELSGGPAACKTWVSSTVNGAIPLP